MVINAGYRAIRSSNILLNNTFHSKLFFKVFHLFHYLFWGTTDAFLRYTKTITSISRFNKICLTFL